MKFVHGIAIPDSDTHFERVITTPMFEGKGTYQYKKIEAALQCVRKRRVALDIGGHVGTWSRVLGRRFERVDAFEPLAQHRECFKHNLADYRNVNLFPHAVSNEVGSLSIHYVGDNTGHSHVGVGEEVRAISIDSVYESDTDVDFIKIDVEGYELPVIQGAEALIKRCRPVMVVEQKPHKNAERYGWGQHDAVSLLKSWGMVELTVMAGDHIMMWRGPADFVR